MEKFDKYHFYEAKEERLNIYSHGFGLILSVVGFILLVFKAIALDDFKYLAGFSIFGASMILLYSASTFYHSAKTKKVRYRLNILDHASIYVLIAGTYTPIALLVLNGVWGWSILIAVWSMAIIGIVLKLFYTGKYRTISTIMYVVMGWVIVFAIKPLIENFNNAGLIWLLGGGISYSIGALLFSLDRIKYNHAIFHVFVLLGTFCHFIAIYLYVLPN